MAARTSPRSLRTVLALVAGALLALSGCGGGGAGGGAGGGGVASTSVTTQPADRYAVTRVLHTTTGEGERVTLQ
ncbi:MAG TPA: hypothetical protein VLQ78_13005, partial [Ornithinibacter sp.]|nr:hypothetical protein [Ornithinibacter sp.]